MWTRCWSQMVLFSFHVWNVSAIDFMQKSCFLECLGFAWVHLDIPWPHSQQWHTATVLGKSPMLVHCAVFQVCKRLSVPCVWLSRFLWDCLEPVASLCPMWHIPHRDARLQVEDRWEQQGYRTAIDSHLRYCRALDLLSHAKSMFFIFLWVYRMVPPQL